MKKIISILLAAVMCLGFVGCNGVLNNVVDTDGNEGDDNAPDTNKDEDYEPHSVITLACPFDTAKYDLQTLIETGRVVKVSKNGEELEGSEVKLDVGINEFRVDYKISSIDRICKVRIARRDKYRVVFNSNGGSFVETQYIEDCGTVNSASVTPTRDRYTFMGWYNEDGQKVDLATTPIAKDTAFVARWEGPNNFSHPDKTPFTYETSSAALNIVWRDYADAFGLRPSEVLCTLKDTSSGAEYSVKVTKNSAEFVGTAPAGASVGQGGGNWTVKITGLMGNYTFIQNALGSEDYTTIQSGTSVTHTIKNYCPAYDDTAALMTMNGRFYDLAGNVIVLKGLVTTNPDWSGFKENTSVAYLERMKEEGVNCIRFSMLMGPSYYEDPEKRAKSVPLAKDAIERTAELGMYCIVDWGVLMQNDNTKPSTGYLPKMQDDANEFFAMLAEENLNNPFVIFEICNEPTVDDYSIGWEKHVKVFEENVIRAIRETGSNNIIIAAPNYHARRLSDDKAAKGDDPIDKPFDTEIAYNVAYTFHCYAYTTTYNINYGDDRKVGGGSVVYGFRLCDALKNGLTVVVTEFSPATASIKAQSTGVLLADFASADKYVNVMLEYDVNYMLFRAISASDSSETSSQHMFVKGNVSMVNTGKWTYDMLTDSGKWYYDNCLNSTGFIKAADFDKTSP